MEEIRNSLQTIVLNQKELLSGFAAVSERVTKLEREREAPLDETDGHASTPSAVGYTQTPPLLPADAGTQPSQSSASPESKSNPLTSRVALTTYPKQIGINPLPMNWGDADPLTRGPVTVSRVPSTIRRRNAIGAHGGSYSIYYALAVASGELDADHKPDFTNTEPAVNIGPFPQWSDPKKIVAMDPWGHQVPWIHKDLMEKENGMFKPPHSGRSRAPPPPPFGF